MRFSTKARRPTRFLEQQGIFMNYDFHSSLSALQPHTLKAKLKETIGAAHYFIHHAKWLIVTYGTAWIYARNDTGEIVANCHKVPQAQFSKSLWSQKKIIESFNSLNAELQALNPGIRIILTVSPGATC